MVAISRHGRAQPPRLAFPDAPGRPVRNLQDAPADVLGPGRPFRLASSRRLHGRVPFAPSAPGWKSRGFRILEPPATGGRTDDDLILAQFVPARISPGDGLSRVPGAHVVRGDVGLVVELAGSAGRQ